MNGAHFCALCLGGKCGAWEDLYGWEVDFPDTVPKPPFVPPTPPKVNMIQLGLTKFFYFYSYFTPCTYFIAIYVPFRKTRQQQKFCTYLMFT